MKFYISFGQQYRREAHPSGIAIHPDAVYSIEAESLKAAHDKAMMIFTGHFHNVYDETKWEEVKHYYPRGVRTP